MTRTAKHEGSKQPHFFNMKRSTAAKRHTRRQAHRARCGKHGNGCFTWERQWPTLQTDHRHWNG